MRFSDLHLSPSLLRSIEEEGYDRPTPIQARAIPPVAQGRDVLGIAQTGTGKTAAFALPILHRLEEIHAAGQGRRIPRVLVVAPTRELAAQIGESFRTYGRHLKIRVSVVFGGVGQRPQEEDLRRGVDVLVACPGRLLDLVGQGAADLSGVEILVLDEADRMLDMGFLPDIKRIVSRVPKKRQTLFFSATMPDEIRDLSAGLLTDPITVAVAPAATAAETVDQWMAKTNRDNKMDLLAKLVREANGRTLVFTRTKHGADRVARKLEREDIEAMAIHGDKSQGARTKALEGFRDGTVPVLVASDIAARGLDIDEIRLVVNYDVPADPDTYVHRIGRTGRAGSSGRAVTFVQEGEEAEVRDIEKRIGRSVPWLDGDALSIPARPEGRKQQPSGRKENGRDNGRANHGKPAPKGDRRGNQPRSESGSRSQGEGSRRNENGGDRSGRGRRPRRNDSRGGQSGNGSQGSQQASPKQDSKPTLMGRLWNKITGGRP